MPDKFIYTPEELLTWLEENTCSEDHVTVELLRCSCRLVADLIAKAPDWEIQARWDDVGKALLDWNVAYNDTRGPHAER